MKNEIQNWTIGVCCTDSDGVSLYHVRGTKSQVKRFMIGLIKDEKKESKDQWDHGTEKVSEIDECTKTELYAYNCFSSYHTDYSATVDTEPVLLDFLLN